MNMIMDCQRILDPIFFSLFVGFRIVLDLIRLSVCMHMRTHKCVMFILLRDIVPRVYLSFSLSACILCNARIWRCGTLWLQCINNTLYGVMKERDDEWHDMWKESWNWSSLKKSLIVIIICGLPFIWHRISIKRQLQFQLHMIRSYIHYFHDVCSKNTKKKII